MQLDRRSFLALASLSAASTAIAVQAEEGRTRNPAKVRLGLSSYSYWHFRPPKVSIETVIDKAAGLGVQGVDILHRQMDMPEREPLDASARAYLRKLKRHAFVNGIDLI
ncbi:MAG: hypothetical protein L0Z50_34950, partial [Verrucomicrobiales bacterium]|nr:hypothetical protein [Verrucomicrobiales bacterium]